MLKKLQAKENRGCETSLESQSPQEDTVGKKISLASTGTSRSETDASKVVPPAEYFQDIRSHMTVM